MEERVVRFIAALRNEGLRVSLAESKDAFQAIAQLGIENREVFRHSLRSTLVKEQRYQESFDTLFPLFFGSGNPPPFQNIAESLTKAETESLEELYEQVSAHIQRLLKDLIGGKPLDEHLLEDASQQVGTSQMDSRRYQEWLSRRVEQALRFSDLNDALNLLEALLGQHTSSERSEQIQQAIAHNLSSWKEQIRQFIGSQLADALSQGPAPPPNTNLLERPFTALTEQDMQQLRLEVRRLAAILKSRIALRQRRARTGTINLKATLRANQKFGGIPIELKRRHRDRKPRLVVICDISTSMRFCSELMLSLLYELSSLISKTHAFTFIDRLVYVSPEFVGHTASEAVAKVLERNPPGYYSTDFGHSLLNFEHDFLDMLDNQTSFIIVGDARNNYNNPQLALFQRLSRRALRTLWINPEPQSQWGQGDSDMWAYAPYCREVLRASNLKQLSAAIDHLLV